jgi:hypothetical protein
MVLSPKDDKPLVFMPKTGIPKGINGHIALTFRMLSANLTMASSEKIEIVRELVEERRLVAFREIFIYIPKSYVAKKLGIKYHRFLTLTRQPGDLRYKESLAIARLLGVDPRILSELVHGQLENKKRVIKARKQIK